MNVEKDFITSVDYFLPKQVVFRGIVFPVDTLFWTTWFPENSENLRLPILTIGLEQLELVKESRITRQSTTEEILEWISREKNQWGRLDCGEGAVL